MSKTSNKYRTALLTSLMLTSMALLNIGEISAAERPDLSPRHYCKTTGGKVIETFNSNIYLCCYPARQSCVASNTAINQTVRINWPWDNEKR